jgi:peroxiredoxin
VQLQAQYAAMNAAGPAIFAISYDSVEVLGSFAERFGIAFPLLSDQGSKVIRELGLYNQHLLEQAQFYGRSPREDQWGVPYPGAFLLDERGVIVDKQFEQSYRVRPDSGLLLRPLGGLPPESAGVVAEAQRPGIRVRAWLASGSFRPYEKYLLHVDLDLDHGIHVYGRPVSADYQALDIALGPVDGLETEPVEWPQPRPLRIEGLGEEFFCYDDELRLSVPFNVQQMHEQTVLHVLIRYQACTETVCYPPAEIALRLLLRGEDLVR